MNDATAILLVLLGIALLPVMVKAAGRQFGWHVELSRKVVHIAMGLATLSFPWIFHSTLAVWILAALACVCLGVVRCTPRFRQHSALCGVERKSAGEFCFPLSVALIFQLAHDRPLLYVIPILILTLADAVGALVGVRYGFSRYATDDGTKSAEGSLAFFVVAFLSTHVPLLLFTATGRLECLLIGAVLGLIVMITEAIAWRGLDNLFVPIAAYACLTRFLELDSGQLLIRLGVLLFILVLVKAWASLTHLTRSAVTASALVVYVSWAGGGWPWLIAPVCTLLGYTILCPDRSSGPRGHSVEAIAAVGGMGLIWLALSGLLGTVNAVYPYGVCYGTHLCLIAAAFFGNRKRARGRVFTIIAAWLTGFAFVAIPCCILWRSNPHLLPLTLVAALLLLLCTIAFVFWQPRMDDCPVDTARWLRQSTLAALASAAAFVIILEIEPWSTSIF